MADCTITMMSVGIKASTKHRGSEEIGKGMLWKENWLAKDKRNEKKKKKSQRNYGTLNE